MTQTFITMCNHLNTHCFLYKLWRETCGTNAMVPLQFTSQKLLNSYKSLVSLAKITSGWAHMGLWLSTCTEEREERREKREEKRSEEKRRKEKGLLVLQGTQGNPNLSRKGEVVYTCTCGTVDWQVCVCVCGHVHVLVCALSVLHCSRSSTLYLWLSKLYT